MFPRNPGHPRLKQQPHLVTSSSFPQAATGCFLHPLRRLNLPSGQIQCLLGWTPVPLPPPRWQATTPFLPARFPPSRHPMDPQAAHTHFGINQVYWVACMISLGFEILSLLLLLLCSNQLTLFCCFQSSSQLTATFPGPRSAPRTSEPAPPPNKAGNSRFSFATDDGHDSDPMVLFFSPVHILAHIF